MKNSGADYPAEPGFQPLQLRPLPPAPDVPAVDTTGPAAAAAEATVVHSNCAELVLKGYHEGKYPRYLRGGSQPSCLRSLSVCSIEQQLGEFSLQLFGDVRGEAAARRGIIVDLDRGTPPLPLRCLSRSELRNNPGDIVALYSVANLLFRDGYSLLSAATEQYARVKILFLKDLQDAFPATHGDIFVPSKESAIASSRRCILSSLSIIQVPVRMRGVSSGSYNREDWGLAILPNPVSMTTAALEHHLTGFYHIYDGLQLQQRRFDTISPEQYRNLKSLIPADTTALIDFLLTRVGVDQATLSKLGVTAARSISVNRRFSELVSETAPRIRERIMQRLAKRRGVPANDISGDSVTAAMRRASQSHCLLRNCMLSAAAEARKISSQAPDLRLVLQSAARAAGGISKTGCDSSYGTPTDAIILQAAWGSPGGQIERLELIAKYYLAEHGLSMERTAVRAALREFEIRFSRVKHTLTPLRLEQYFCAHRIKTQRQIAALFSAYCRRGSCDASKLFRCDALSNNGGAMTMTVEADTVQGPDHDCGGDHKSKLGAYGVFFEPAQLENADPEFGLFPPGFDAAKSIGGWSREDLCMKRDGLACVLGHVERLGGETASRNWNDRLEVIATYPEDFRSPDGAFVPILFFEEDNAKGCRDFNARFCLVLFADILGLDYVDDASNAAENSKFHSVEGMWGATRHRTGGKPIMLDVVHWESATEEEKLEASKKACRCLMERYDGATFAAGGGQVNANVAGSVPTDWVFRDDEIKQFLALNPGPGFNGFAPTNQAQLDFVCDPMLGYDENPAEVYRRVWRKMSASGDKQCFFLYLNAMTYASNPLNIDCAARRAPPVFWELLGRFSDLGLTMPQGIPSKTRVGKLMNFGERMESAHQTTKEDNGPDAHHPVRKFADIDAEMKFIENAKKGEPLSAKYTEIISRELCVDIAVIDHHVKVAVFKAERKQGRDNLKGDLKLSGKQTAVADFVRQRLGLASVVKQLKSGETKSYPATVKKSHLLETLLELGVSTGKKNREVTEAHVPALTAMIFDKAGLSVAPIAGPAAPAGAAVAVAAVGLAAVTPPDGAALDAAPLGPALVVAMTQLGTAAADDALVDVTPGDSSGVTAEAALSDDDELSEDDSKAEIEDDGGQVLDNEDGGAEEEGDLASWLEQAATGAPLGRGFRSRKRARDENFVYRYPGE